MTILSSPEPASVVLRRYADYRQAFRATLKGEATGRPVLTKALWAITLVCLAAAWLVSAAMVAFVACIIAVEMIVASLAAAAEYRRTVILRQEGEMATLHCGRRLLLAFQQSDAVLVLLGPPLVRNGRHLVAIVDHSTGKAASVNLGDQYRDGLSALAAALKVPAPILATTDPSAVPADLIKQAS